MKKTKNIQYAIFITMNMFGCITKQTEGSNNEESSTTEVSEPNGDRTVSNTDTIDRGMTEDTDGGLTLTTQDMLIVDQAMPDDMNTEISDAFVEIDERCINACSDTVACLGGECDGSPVDDYAQCVNACTAGTLRLEDIESVNCTDLKTWVCEGSFAGQCGCRLDNCEQSCQNVLQCLQPICESQVLTFASCLDFCEESPDRFEINGLNLVSCEEVQTGLCPLFSAECRGCPQPDPDTFNIGSSCERDADCQAGELRPYCIASASQETNDTEWSGGYCSGLDCNGGDCGANGLCLVADEMGQTLCLSLCGENLPDCRMGYGCETLGFNNLSVCIPF